MAKNKNSLSDLKDIFKSVDDLNPDAEILDQATISTPDEWIDTGSYALNAIISGSLHKGIPVGRITGFSGPSQAGKTLIMNKIMGNAQKVGFVPVIWDSEVAVDRKSATGAGLDPSRVKYYPVETVEDCRNQMCVFLDNVIKARESNPELKFIAAIDSLGNLASSKEIKDAAAGKDAADVGQKAKAIKSMMRVLTYKAAKARVPILFSNHIYEGMEMFPTLVKTQSGGKGPIYLASVLVQLSTRNEKSSDNPAEESIAIAHNISGVTLGALTIKNRFVPAYLKTELYLNFKSGLDKHAGLFEIAEAFKVIEKPGRTVMYKGESLGYRKDLEKSEDFWKKILPELEAVLNEKLCYGQQDTAKVIQQEIDEIDEISNDTE
jgi:RecA/RadA recombinase